MKWICLVVLLAGCSHNVTLHPRGGGTPATGSFNDGSMSMTVTIDGETYTGDYARGGSTGFMLGSGGAILPMFGVSNAHSAVLIGKKGTLRCEWVLEGFGGNGVCQDARTTYDLIVK